MTYMPADKLLLSQALLDRKFHEYKLAALTGLMSNWDRSKFSTKDLQDVAVVCAMAACAMQELDEAHRVDASSAGHESGEN